MHKRWHLVLILPRVAAHCRRAWLGVSGSVCPPSTRFPVNVYSELLGSSHSTCILAAPSAACQRPVRPQSRASPRALHHSNAVTACWIQGQNAHHRA
jgi:hypothetical protein